MNCVDKAKEVILRHSNQLGTSADGLYTDIWARDSLISSLGMSKSGDRQLIEIAKRNIDTLATYQKHTGQIPNKVSPRGDMVCFGEGGCVDSSLWYPLAALEYYKASKDKKFLYAHIYKIEKAIYWAHCLDVNNDNLIETNEGSDWMDVLLRSGRVLYDNVLLYAAMKAADKIKEIIEMETKYEKHAEELKASINTFFWPKTGELERVRKKYGFSGIDKDFETTLRAGERNYYLAEVGFRRFDARCDVFANTLAIFFDVAGKEETKKIMEFFEKEKVYEPYPIRVLTPPIYDNDAFRFWHFRESDLPFLQYPGNYHNGAVWPFAGGFYVAMLKKLGMNSNEIEKKLITANELGNGFSEWISSSGNPGGSSNQTWSAAMLIYALKFKG